MPIQSCSSGGKPGFKFGRSGKCFTYTSGNAASRSRARARAARQGRAIEANKLFNEILNELKDGRC